MTLLSINRVSNDRLRAVLENTDLVYELIALISISSSSDNNNHNRSSSSDDEPSRVLVEPEHRGLLWPLFSPN